MRKTWSARLLAWLPAGLLIAFEAYLSSFPSLPVVPGFTFPHADKVVHAGYFFLNAMFIVLAAHFFEGWSKRKTFLTVLFAIALYGTLDEIHQAFVPNRSSDPFDILADVLGASLAGWVGPWIWTRLGLPRLLERMTSKPEPRPGLAEPAD
jgi:VanZ family protein